MVRKTAGILGLIAALSFAASARANVVVTLEAFDTNGAPIAGPVAAGTEAVVDILLSADVADDPVVDIRSIQFDFANTSAAIQLDSFVWSVDANAYSFQVAQFPVSNVVSILMQSGPGLLTLTSEPVKVASVEVTINGTGTLDVTNPGAFSADEGVDVEAGFSTRSSFSLSFENVSGGTLPFSVPGDNGGGGGGNPPDSDGDGVPDSQDAFPNDPAETTDTDGNGIGDNADSDDDGDGVVDVDDDLPTDPDETTDTNDDGVGNNADPDDDGDGVDDGDDAFPTDPDETTDDDGNGVGDNADNEDESSGNTPSMCGAGMLGPSLLMLMGLGLISYRPRRKS